jgi:murein DD-endopeptidase MepM/ murein hydrolase activator NlpD
MKGGQYSKTIQHKIGKEKMELKLFKPVIVVLMFFMAIQGGSFIARPDHIVKALGGTNLAIGKAATASSVQGSNAASRATDGLTTTAWSSTFAEPAWIYVDLGSPQAIQQVILVWERAYGLEYQIEGSNNATTWTLLSQELHGDGGTDTIAVNGTWRYVRMYGTQRGTGWGFSIWEFQIFDIAQTAPPAEPYIPSLLPKPASQLLFSDDFSSGDIAPWQVGQGTWQVTNGALTSSFPCSGGSPYTITAGDTTWTDFQLTLDVRRLAGYDPGGILIRNSASGYYRVDIMPSIPYGGAVRVIKSTTGESVQTSWPFNANTLYKIIIDVEGPAIDVYVMDAEQNAKLLLSYKDTNAPFLTGNIGFFMAAGAVCPTEVAFDNVQVRQIEPSYLVSGVVRNAGGDPISEVQLSADGLGISTITRLDGSYTLGRFAAGTYTITPARSGYRFLPVSRAVNGPPDAVHQDFTVPFLDLPLDYSKSSFETAAQGSNGGGGPGYVNSWFDHTNPGYGKVDGHLTTWQGPYTNSSLIDKYDCATKPGGLGISCYDEHDGIDFRHVSDEILAAAPGKVISAGSGSFGQQILIDHNNCFATLYGHLSSISVNPQDPIADRQKIGMMGNTGLSLGAGNGIHLHFGVYFDPDCDGDWSNKIPVDPYPWRGTGKDPWEDVPDTGLWKYKVSDPTQVDHSGGIVSSPGGDYIAAIPAGAVSETLTLELLASPPVSVPSAQLRSTGYSFWMRVLEWLAEGSSAPGELTLSSLAGASTNSFNTPVTVTIDFDPASMPHIDINQLAIQQWDETGQAWNPLATTLDTINHQAAAQTIQPGRFDLQGPLVCPADTLEPNDNYDGSSVLLTDGSPVSSLFDMAQDEDWFQVDAFAGAAYQVQTADLANGVGTLLEIYDRDGVSVLASEDDSSSGQASLLTWQAPQDGTYFIRVIQAPGSSYGCTSSYQISVSPLNFKTSIDIGGVDSGNHDVPVHGSKRQGYTGLNNGPVQVTSHGSLSVTSQRVIYGGGSYSEMIGLPFEQLSKEYLFPYYNNVAMDSQLRVSNVGGAGTTIKVYLGADPDPIDQFTLAAGEAKRKNYTARNSGPLRVASSDANILATIRVLYNKNSYSELMGLPVEQLAKEYLFPYYNNVAMDSQLRVSNVGGASATIKVFLGSNPDPIDQYTLAAGGATRKNYTGRNSGPLRVTSSDSNILTTIRVLYNKNSYSELMGFPAGQLSQSYWYPVYDNVAVDSQLRVSNVGSGTTHITVYAGGAQIDSYDLAEGAATRRNYPQNTGPLQVVSSSQPVLTTVRLLYAGNSYYEMTGLPEEQLSTRYFFPWYNNTAMSSELRFAMP